MDRLVIDWAEGAQLVGGSEAVARDMVAMLVQRLPADMDELQVLWQQHRDVKALLDCVHRLCGGLCYCGVPQLRHEATLLKEVCYAQDAAQIDLRLPIVLQAARRLLQRCSKEF